MANEQNLKVLSPTEARELGRIGGVVSGQARRERKRLRDIAMTMASAPLTFGYDEHRKEAFCKRYNIDNPTILDNIMAELIISAQGGNLKAIRLFFDLVKEQSAPFVIPDPNSTLTQQEIKVSYKAKQQKVD